MQVNSETLTNTIFVTVHGYEFRIWWNQLNFTGEFGWQVDAREADGTWSYHSCDYGLTEAFNGIRIAVGL